MEHGPVGRADACEGLEHLVVGVAIVDLHRDAVLLGEGDVRFEAEELRRQAVALGAEEVEPGLTDRAHARLRRELVDYRDRLAEHSLGGICRRLVGMDRHRGEHAGVGCRGPGRPATRLDVTAGLHDARDPDLAGAQQLLVERHPVAVLDLEMAVVVVDRDGQRLG